MKKKVWGIVDKATGDWACPGDVNAVKFWKKKKWAENARQDYVVPRLFIIRPCYLPQPLGEKR